MKRERKNSRDPRGAQRRQRPADPPEDDDEDDDQEGLVEGGDDREEQDLDEVLRALAQELGEDSNQARVHVHRIVANGESQRCFSCPALQFSSETIREQWGPGTYSVMTYVRGRLRHRDRITFAEPVRPATPAPASSAADPSLLAVVTRLEQRIERDQAQQFELMKIIAGTGTRAQLDPLQIQQSTLAMLTSVRELTGGADRGGDGRSSLDAFLEGVKIAQKLRGEGGEGSTDWAGVVLGVAEGIKSIAASQAEQPRRLAGPAGPAKPPSAPPAMSSPDSDPNGETDVMDKLRQALQFLVKKAAASSDPTLYADVAIDNLSELPELMQSIAIDYIKRDDCLDRLAKIEPGVATHREWFTACVAEIRRLLSPQEASPPLTDGDEPPDPDA